MATLVTKTLGPGKDYANLAALAAANVDLPALDQYWEVTCDDMIDGPADFNGWNTDATRYLHIKAKTMPTKPHCDLYGKAGYRIWAPGAHGITITDVATAGTEGLIIFEGVQVAAGFGANTHALYTVTSAVETQVQMKRCILCANAGGGGCGAYLNGTKVVVKFYNCFLTSAADYGVRVVQASTNHADLYSCTVFGGTFGIDCNGRACVLKNSYFSGTNGIANAAGATITYCATSDASGDPAALDTIAKDLTHFRALGKMHEDCRVMPENSHMIAGGSAITEGYTVDLIGNTWVTATPTVGCCEHIVEDPYIIRRTYCKQNSSYTTYDYSTISSIANLDIDCVTNHYRIIIEMYAKAGDNTAATFDGWNTDATYYLHFRPSLEADDLAENSFQPWLCANNAAFQDVSPCLQVAAGCAITIGDIGESGFIHFEGLNLSGTDPAISIGANFAHQGATVRFSRMIAYNYTNEKKCITINAGSAGTLQLFNCLLVSDNTVVGAGGTVDVKAYHVTAMLYGNGGAGNICFDGGNRNGTEFVNCMALVAAGFAGASGYGNLANVVQTTCGSTDATGTPAGLDSIAYNSTNFAEAGTFGTASVMHLPSTSSALYGVGTDLSGYAAPYNISTDYTGCPRPTPPSIGCADIMLIPNRITLDSFNQGGVGHTFDSAENVMATCIEKAGSKYYIGCGGAVAGYTPSVYETTAFVDFDEVFTVADANNYIAGMAQDNTYLYVLYKSTCLVQKMLIADGTWSAAAAANLGGAAGAPVTPKALVHFDSHLFAATDANATATIYECNDADNGATWTASLLVSSTDDCRGLVECMNHLVAFMESGKVYIREVGGSWAMTQIIPWCWQTDGNGTSLMKIGNDLWLGVFDKCNAGSYGGMFYKMNWGTHQFEIQAFPTWWYCSRTMWGTSSSPKTLYFNHVSGGLYKHFICSKDNGNHRQYCRMNTDTPAANEPYPSAYNTYLMGMGQYTYRLGKTTYICGGGGSAPAGAGLFQTNEYVDDSGNTLVMYGGVA